jgi:hypothetical protein
VIRAHRAPALVRWWRYLRLAFGENLPARELIRSPEQDRRRQASAARQAFLSQQSPGQRVLAGPQFGDTH